MPACLPLSFQMVEAVTTRVRLRHPVRYRLEAIGAWILFNAFRALPLDTASALGAVLGRTIGFISPNASHRARGHIARAMPELRAQEVRRIVWAMWANLGRNMAELAHLPTLGDRSGPDGRIEIVGQEHICDAIQSDSAVLFFSAHLGNWECLPFLEGGPDRSIAVVHRQANNPFVERLLARAREATAVELVAKGPQGARRLLGLVKAKYIIAMLADQKLNDGIAVPFFGRDAMTAPALAQFALHYDLPVLPVRCERLMGARFRITVSPPLDHPNSGDRDADVRAMMTEVNQIIENWIRERPEQWLWLHRRWPQDS